MTTVVTDELLPCPFCGSDDIYQREDGSPFSIRCNNCLAEMPYMSLDDPQSVRWNTRSTASPQTDQVERRQWESDEPSPKPLACYDCGLPYESEAWIEAVVPHEIWNEHLSPRGNSGGILCINCMAARATAKGLRDIPCVLAAGPFVQAIEIDEGLRSALERLCLAVKDLPEVSADVRAAHLAALAQLEALSSGEGVGG